MAEENKEEKKLRQVRLKGNASWAGHKACHAHDPCPCHCVERQAAVGDGVLPQCLPLFLFRFLPVSLPEQNTWLGAGEIPHRGGLSLLLRLNKETQGNQEYST